MKRSEFETWALNQGWLPYKRDLDDSINLRIWWLSPQGHIILTNFEKDTLTGVWCE